MSYTQCHQVVADQAKLLDRKRPGWYNKVNAVTLDQASAHRCVLGQVYGSYYEGLKALQLISAPDTDGFDGGKHYGVRTWNAAEETHAWREEIHARRQNPLDYGTLAQPVRPESVESETFTLNRSDYIQYELPGGRFVYFPSEWLDKMYVELRSLGSNVERFLLEWEA